ncbi:RNA polymerase sigma-70 factor, ECF subfamily [Bacillus mycoides KBAB4]|uniref:RNA polymerase sigma-70 factor, ECF subfamily n=1 Tax=Bacillus mycoides (strain KBAB4) TaxID=315730 RepID=A9VJF7_BACMK|nr:RNA polymerase sigma-70 factor, ECF subfamily [Bacillus mycoides KBAB4]ETT76343.1 ECF subfamily RNA polymerase sigma factor [Bacillus mycoides FSL H7-687]
MDEVELKEWLYKMESGDQEAFRVIYKLTSKDIYRQ